MSSKITKRMMSSVDDMVSRASSATKRTGLVTTKRKAAKRALLEAPSKRRGGSGGAASAALKSGSKTVSKKGRKKNGRAIGLLEQARLELRSKSQAARNVSLLSYVRGKEGTKTRTGKLTVSKSRRAVEKLLVLDGSKARTPKAFP